MPTFNFRLQAVLNYRRSLRDREQVALAAVEQRRAQEQQMLVALRAAEQAALARLAGRRGQVLDLTEVLRLEQHLEALARQVADQTAVLDRLRAEVEQAQQRLIERDRDVKGLEKLRERQADEFADEHQRLEQHETNEGAALLHRRGRSDP